MSNNQNTEIEEMKEEMRSENNTEDTLMDKLIKQMDEPPVANSIRIYNSTGRF